MTYGKEFNLSEIFTGAAHCGTSSNSVNDFFITRVPVQNIKNYITRQTIEKNDKV